MTFLVHTIINKLAVVSHLDPFNRLLQGTLHIINLIDGKNDLHDLHAGWLACPWQYTERCSPVEMPLLGCGASAAEQLCIFQSDLDQGKLWFNLVASAELGIPYQLAQSFRRTSPPHRCAAML